MSIDKIKLLNKKNNAKSAKNTLATKSFDEELFNERLHKHYDELKWLYCELYQNNSKALAFFETLVQELKEYAVDRADYLNSLDETRASETKWYSHKNFVAMQMYPELFAGDFKSFAKRFAYLAESNVNHLHLLAVFEQNDVATINKKLGSLEDLCIFLERCHEENISVCLDYSLASVSSEDEPIVFNDIAKNILTLANYGADMIALNNLPKNHNVVRMIRMICEIVCPTVALLGKVNTSTEDKLSYIGSKDKGQCHLIYNDELSAQLWHTLATGDAGLLKHKIDELENNVKDKDVVYQNSVRSLEGIKWNLDYGFLKSQGTDELLHKDYLNNFYEGKFEGSFALGKLCQCEDKHICGTSASLCGIEYFDKQKDKDRASILQAIDCEVLLHSVLFSLSGMAVVASGDEIAQYNNERISLKQENAHELNQAVFNWRKAGRRNIKNGIQAGVYQRMLQMENIRFKYEVFNTNAKVYTLATWDKSVLAIVRETPMEKFIGLYNFSAEEHTAWIDEKDGVYTDLLTSRNDITASGIVCSPYQTIWLWHKK